MRAEASAPCIRVVIAEEPAGSTEETPLALLVALLDNADSPVYVKDVYGRYLYANRALADLYGLPAERLIGAADADLFDPAVARSLWEAEQRVLESEAPLTVEETLPGARPGQVYVSHRFALLDREGQPTAIASISTDIAGQPAPTRPRRSAERILALNDCFLSFGPDPEENMRRLTTLSNTSRGRATYQRAGAGSSPRSGCGAPRRTPWSTPLRLERADLAPTSWPATTRRSTSCATCSPRRTPAPTRTSPSSACRRASDGRCAWAGGCWALCVLYCEDYAPSDEDGRLLGIVASALAVEERACAPSSDRPSPWHRRCGEQERRPARSGCFIHQELRR